MKKTLSSLSALIVAIFAVFAFSLSCSAAEKTTVLKGENVYVSSFAQLKQVLENTSYKDNINNVTLKNNITVNDNSKDYGIVISNTVELAVDLNGFNIDVTSDATQNLFEITGQAKIFFVTKSLTPDVGNSVKRSRISFNSSHPASSIVCLNNNGAEVTNINLDFDFGSDENHKKTTDGSDTHLFYVKKGTRLDIFSGLMNNRMENGNGIGIEANSVNRARLTFRIGGGSAVGESTTVGAKKHCVVIDPANVSNVRFGSCFFESLNEDTAKYERLLVPSTSTATVKTFWPALDASTSVFAGSILPVSHSTKITSLPKANINADKQCEALSSATDYVILQYAGGHVYVCGTCYISYDQIQNHTTTPVSAKDATCSSSGRTSGELCTVCGYSSSRTVPATGHTMTYYPPKEATCSTNGNKAYYSCNNCKLIFADEKGETRLSSSDVIIKSTHKTVVTSRVEPTCTTDGKTEGAYCETCKKTVKEQTVIPATGHKETAIGIAVAPTCTGEGKTAGKKCSVCKAVIEEQKAIAKLNHKTETVKGYKATCTKNGLTDSERCTVCNITVKDAQVIPATGHTEKIIEGKKADCQNEGLTDGVECSVCSEVLKKQEVISKGPHTPQTVKGKEASCQTEGLSDGTKCSVCGLVLEEQRVIPKGEHKAETVKGFEATCTKEGLTDGSKCSVCKVVLKAQQTIAKLPHSEKVIEAVEATCTSKGKTAGIICSVCNAVIKEHTTTEKAPHSEKLIEGTAATCTKEGKESGIECAVCGEIIKDGAVIPKIGHTVSSSTVRADLNNDGEFTETCAVCGKVLSETTVYKIKSVKLSAAKYTYNGKKKTPSVAVKDSKGNTLKKGTDYTVSYDSGRKAVGKYTVKVTFIGKYAGEKVLSFSVLPSKTAKVKASATTASIKLKWSKVEGATGYRVYLYNTKTKNYKTIETTTKNTLTVKKLKAGTSYRFAVKAYTKTDGGNLWAKVYTEYTTSTALNAPTVKLASKSSQVTLSFSSVSGADGYVVYMADNKNGDYERLGATKKKSYTVKELKKGQKCYFKVRAFKKVGGQYVYSAYTDVMSIKVK